MSWVCDKQGRPAGGKSAVHNRSHIMFRMHPLPEVPDAIVESQEPCQQNFQGKASNQRCEGAVNTIARRIATNYDE